MRLSDLQTGDKAVVVKVLGYGAFRKRIIEMGFVRGQTVLVELNAPLKDPIKYKIMDYEISLRRSEASLVEVITPEEANQLENRQGEKNKLNVESWKTEEDDCIERALTQSSKTINIALVGNPNCGKTSLFNFAPVNESFSAFSPSIPKYSFTLYANSLEYKFMCPDGSTLHFKSGYSVLKRESSTLTTNPS